MSIELNGFDDVLNTLENLGEFGKKIEVNSLRKAMKAGLPYIQNVAPSDTGNSKSKLDVGKIKKYKSGSVWGNMGITSKNWEQTKGLYFQHYGYHNMGRGGRYHGKMVTKNKGWFDRAYDVATQPVLNSLEKEMTNELDKIIR